MTQPRSELDPASFAKLKRILPTFQAARRVAPAAPVRELPQEIAFKLTNRCNLRCKHCYQWNEEGHHRDLSKAEQREDLDFAIVAKVFEATRELGSNVYLWGGEPLIYSAWEDLADLLERDPRWTSMCTNGLDIKRRLDSLLKISDTLELLFALEGFQPEHDAIRGNRAYERLMTNLELLLAEQRAGRYRGEISVNLVITDGLVPRLIELLEFLEQLGIDTVYVSYLWYLSPATSAEMDEYVARHYPWMNPGRRPSWHAYKYGMDPASAQALAEQVARVNARSWRFKVRYNPELAAHELEEFLGGSSRPAQGKTRCLAVKTRMDVFPNGDVVTCKFFGEFAVANLRTSSVRDAWNASGFGQVRAAVDEQLMPVCSKCNLLYTRGT